MPVSVLKWWFQLNLAGGGNTKPTVTGVGSLLACYARENFYFHTRLVKVQVLQYFYIKVLIIYM